MTEIAGRRVRLRLATEADVADLARIRSTPEVSTRWPIHGDLETEIRDELADPGAEILAVELDGGVIGAIQWYEETDPDYRHAGIDVYLDPAHHGRGFGADAVRTLARWLIEQRGHHRVIIDPAADNGAAIACYRKVGFREVGIMRDYERGPDGTWHDGLLMDLLADDLRDG